MRTLDRRQVTELFDIREALEVLAARGAAQNVVIGEPNRLTDVMMETRVAVDNGDCQAAYLANSRFHDELIALSDNSLLQEMLKPLLGRLHWLFRQISDVEEVRAEHAVLTDIITQGDPDLAAEAARAHVLYYRKRTLESLFG